MATIEERLFKRLINVPGVDSAKVADWVTEAKTEISDEEASDNVIFYLALSITYESIAQDAARYFKYTDNEESVDKSMLFDKYMKLADNARKKYRRYKRGGYGSFQPKRADDR